MNFLHQPKAVLAVAFACVIAFMGIGLVDPILKPIADSLGATPSQTSLLFTSYMVVMGLAMLITSAVSSRLGVKRTLLLGLAIIIVSADWPGPPTRSAPSSAGARCGAWATRCSSPPRSPPSSPARAARCARR
ncbi:MFS transporter [Ottowia pentelensis]|uniref:MFS transporter n=1 Tax=Ottowia pentelensis TaxID=511108 RepID=UPI0036261001